MAGKGGGAWKVAYADFVTAMMAFFMVMWLVSQSEKVKDAVAESFRDPKEKMLLLRKPLRNEELTRGRYRTRSNNPIASEDPKDPPFDRPRLQTIRESERTTVGSIIPFIDDSVELDDEARRKIDLLLPLIAGKPQKLELRGHSSRKPPKEGSPFRDAWEFSYARCKAVRDYLEENGVAPNRIRLSQAAGYEPITTKTDSKQQAKNPRVEVFLINEWAEDFVGTRSERAERFETKDER